MDTHSVHTSCKCIYVNDRSSVVRLVDRSPDNEQRFFWLLVLINSSTPRTFVRMSACFTAAVMAAGGWKSFLVPTNHTHTHGVTASVNVVDANVCVCVCVWCYRDQRTLFIHPCCCLPSGGIITHTHAHNRLANTHTHASTLMFAAASSCQIANQSGGEGWSGRAEQK